MGHAVSMTAADNVSSSSNNHATSPRETEKGQGGGAPTTRLAGTCSHLLFSNKWLIKREGDENKDGDGDKDEDDDHEDHEDHVMTTTTRTTMRTTIALDTRMSSLRLGVWDAMSSMAALAEWLGRSVVDDGVGVPVVPRHCDRMATSVNVRPTITVWTLRRVRALCQTHPMLHGVGTTWRWNRGYLRPRPFLCGFADAYVIEGEHKQLWVISKATR